MSGPAVLNTYTQERRGVAAVQMFAATHGVIFRETPTGDVGIDAQMEFVRVNGFTTGHLIALQIKSGRSYFEHDTGIAWKFYHGKKHGKYWENYPLPVILVLHDPSSARSYWIDARQELRTPSKGLQPYIEVPRKNVLEDASPASLFENAGVQEEIFIEDLNAVLDALLDRRNQGAGFPLSFFDLFCGRLTNICRSIYFGTDVAMTMVEGNLAMRKDGNQVSMGLNEHDFLFAFIRFLVAQNLADVNFSDCLIDILDRQMTPAFIAPLTWRGRRLVSLIGAKEQELIERGDLPDENGLRVAQEGFVALDPLSYWRRLPRIFKYQSTFRP
jgi:hypothetical protein